MTRLRFNNLSGTLGASLSSSGTTITFTSAPAFGTVASPDYVALELEPGSTNFEIVYLTAFTAGSTTGTITRAQEGTSGVAHASNATWVDAPTVADFTSMLTAASNLSDVASAATARTNLGAEAIGRFAGYYALSLSGAVGNGVTDDAPAINAFLATIPEGGIVVVDNPSVAYGIGSPLVMNPGTALVSDGTTWQQPGGAGPSQTYASPTSNTPTTDGTNFRMLTGFTGIAAITTTGVIGNSQSPDKAVLIRGLVIDGQNGNNTFPVPPSSGVPSGTITSTNAGWNWQGHGIYLVGSHNLVQDCYLFDVPQSAIVIGNYNQKITTGTISLTNVLTSTSAVTATIATGRASATMTTPVVPAVPITGATVGGSSGAYTIAFTTSTSSPVWVAGQKIYLSGMNSGDTGMSGLFLANGNYTIAASPAPTATTFTINLASSVTTAPVVPSGGWGAAAAYASTYIARIDSIVSSDGSSYQTTGIITSITGNQIGLDRISAGQEPYRCVPTNLRGLPNPVYLFYQLFPVDGSGFITQNVLQESTYVRNKIVNPGERGIWCHGGNTIVGSTVSSQQNTDCVINDNNIFGGGRFFACSSGTDYDFVINTMSVALTTVTVGISKAHHLTSGQWINIIGCVATGGTALPDGFYQVSNTGTPGTATSFDITVATPPTGTYLGGGRTYYGRTNNGEALRLDSAGGHWVSGNHTYGSPATAILVNGPNAAHIESNSTDSFGMALLNNERVVGIDVINIFNSSSTSGEHRPAIVSNNQVETIESRITLASTIGATLAATVVGMRFAMNGASPAAANIQDMGNVVTQIGPYAGSGTLNSYPYVMNGVSSAITLKVKRVGSTSIGTGTNWPGPTYTAVDFVPEFGSATLVVATSTHSSTNNETTLCTTGTFTNTLPTPVASGFCRVVNTGAGTITITPPLGTLTDIAGATGNISLTTHTSRAFMSDGTNWYQVA